MKNHKCSALCWTKLRYLCINKFIKLMKSEQTQELVNKGEHRQNRRGSNSIWQSSKTIGGKFGIEWRWPDIQPLEWPIKFIITGNYIRMKAKDWKTLRSRCSVGKLTTNTQNYRKEKWRIININKTYYSHLRKEKFWNFPHSVTCSLVFCEWDCNNVLFQLR